jgi:hypothetical protein
VNNLRFLFSLVAVRFVLIAIAIINWLIAMTEFVGGYETI